MTEEECRKNNICPFCYGKIYLKMPKDRQIRCGCEDGTYVGYSISEKDRFEINRERDNRNHKLLQDWVKETSKCETCGGDQRKTWGLFNCKECGIPGTGFWPG